MVRLLLLGTPVLSDSDLRIVERLAWRAGVPKGPMESLSTDVTGDGAPDVVLLTRTSDRLVLFVAEGPVSPVGRWWRVDLHRGTGAGELCVPAAAARVLVEDHGVVAHALECDREQTGACPTPRGRALRVEASPAVSRTGAGPHVHCPAVHVFFDGSDLRFWSGAVRADAPHSGDWLDESGGSRRNRGRGLGARRARGSGPVTDERRRIGREGKRGPSDPAGLRCQASIPAGPFAP